MEAGVRSRVGALASGLFVFVASSAPAAPGGPYYVSLGTSLAVGVQPDENGENQLTDEGYADQLHGLLRLKNRRLQLVKLGCPGETSTAMIRGGKHLLRHWPTSQLGEAVAFLQANPGAVALVTLDIGANDLLTCAESCRPSRRASLARLRRPETNLPAHPDARCGRRRPGVRSWR